MTVPEIERQVNITMSTITEEKIVVDHEIDTKGQVVSIFAEIIKDSQKEPLKYIQNWQAPGGGE
jgi:hypothetical protein